ncbi:hypothetical protein GDO81_016145 [Engystomops pustulosus]|uniref:Uncharacterized protein n=1 Tax=Engystomops pustulosus TaxID=76066 RepID=A0AAV7AZU2_ENGPU|nr:hypothetical protein GDO81_016145 [Engystomops pustulosus]
MEKGGYFSFFPMSQTETNLHYKHRSLKQQQIREKELLLCNQLEVVCQRQYEAHRRNQNLLRDFKKIEQALAQLAAKNDDFRINQVNYTKQFPAILPMHYTCFPPRSCTLRHDNKSIDYGEPGHIRDHFSQANRNNGLWPNHLIGQQGCCRQSSCCGCCMNCYSDAVFMCCKESLKKRKSTTALLLHRDESSIKDDIRDQCPEFTNDVTNTSRNRTIPPSQDPLQYIRNEDLYRHSSQMFLEGVNKTVVAGKVKADLKRPVEDNRRGLSEIPLNSTAEEYEESLKSIYELKQLPTALINLKHCSDDHQHNKIGDENASVRKLSTPKKNGGGQSEDSQQQNVLAELLMEIHNENICTDGNETWFSLENTIMNGCDKKGLVEILKRNKTKESCNSDIKDQMTKTSDIYYEETNIIHTSNTEHIGGETLSQPTTTHSSNQKILKNSDKHQDRAILGVVLGGSFEESSSDSEEISESKGGAEECKLVKDKMLGRQKSFENYQNESVQSDLSDDTVSNESNKRRSTSDKCLQMKDLRQLNGKAKSELGMFSKGDDEKKGEIGEVNKTQEVEEGKEVMKIVLRSTEIGISKPRVITNCAMYEEDTDINSDTEDDDKEESTSGKYPGQETKDINDATDNSAHENHFEDEEDDDKGDGDDNSDEDDNSDHEDKDDENYEDNYNEEDRMVSEEDRIQQIDIHKEDCSTEASENEELSLGEEEGSHDSSDVEKSFCENHDEIEDTDLIEEEPNVDLWSRSSKCTNTETEKMNLRKDGGATRKDESADLEDQATVNCQELKEDGGQIDTENQRSHWLCCLKSCFLSDDTRENLKRCSEDGNMDLLQLNPVESASSFLKQELCESPTFRNTEAASAHRAPSEGKFVYIDQP